MWTVPWNAFAQLICFSLHLFLLNKISMEALKAAALGILILHETHWNRIKNSLAHSTYMHSNKASESISKLVVLCWWAHGAYECHTCIRSDTSFQCFIGDKGIETHTRTQCISAIHIWMNSQISTQTPLCVFKREF